MAIGVKLPCFMGYTMVLKFHERSLMQDSVRVGNILQRSKEACREGGGRERR